MVNLWENEQLSEVARATLGSEVQRLLAPVMSSPSELLGAGPVASAHLPKLRYNA